LQEHGDCKSAVHEIKQLRVLVKKRICGSCFHWHVNLKSQNIWLTKNKHYAI